jgi:hypothetical protein
MSEVKNNGLRVSLLPLVKLLLQILMLLPGSCMIASAAELMFPRRKQPFFPESLYKAEWRQSVHL